MPESPPAWMHSAQGGSKMRLTAIVKCCKETGLYVGYVPGFPGAHSQGETLDEFNEHLKEVVPHTNVCTV